MATLPMLSLLPGYGSYAAWMVTLALLDGSSV